MTLASCCVLGVEILCFIHQFFQFSGARWTQALQGRDPDWRLARRFFEDPPFARRLLQKGAPHSFSEARLLFSRWQEQEQTMGIRAIPEHFPAYPAAILSHLPPSRRPPLLYLRGPSLEEEGAYVGVVGTRSPSAFGQEAALDFSTYFSALRIRIMSGLARGIDSIAHRAGTALGTVAVLGAGVDAVYPEENQGLAEDILQFGGTLLSPFPCGQVPLPQNFPERNELIAALSTGVLVVEGAEKSGAAITGRCALAMGKAVAVLAQNFRSAFGRGAIRLQQDGATLVASEEEAVQTLFQRLGGHTGGSAFPSKLSPSSRTCFTFSEFRETTKLGVSEAVALLEEGLLRGKIERWGNKYRLR